MSNDTSPTHHLPPTYPNTTPVTHLPPTFSDPSYSSGEIKPELEDPPQSSSKGKNGATGPADGKAKPHVCQICSRGFTTGGHLQRHQRIHTGVKAFKCPFPGCETRTSRQDNLQQHYRTHLSPTLRRGSGSAARAAVAAAMEAAGLKSTSTRAPRKSKGSATPSSTSAASAGHLPSPYQTPTGPGPYAGYNMYDPAQYAPYPIPQGVQSANSSRVPSPVNGHSSGHSSMSGHQQPYFSQPFSPAYTYAGGNIHQPYRYGPAPYAHHGYNMEHGQMYSPMQTGFPTHSRESSYGVVGYPQINNGYPPRTSTPLSQAHGEEPYPRRPPSPHRRSPLLSQGVVDPSNMSRMQPSFGGYSHMPYNYSTATAMRDPVVQPDAPVGNGPRGSISSLSDGGSGNGGSDGSGKAAVQQ